MTIGTILAGREARIITVDADETVGSAVERLDDNRIGAMPVMRGGAVVGVVSERDVIHHLRSDGDAILGWPVERVMTSPAITVARDLPVLAALSQMTRRRIRHLPVVEGGRLVGIVSIGDLVAYRITRIEEEAEALRVYIQTA